MILCTTTDAESGKRKREQSLSFDVQTSGADVEDIDFNEPTSMYCKMKVNSMCLNSIRK